MTAPVNGRVSQRDLYDALSRLEGKVDGHYHRLDDRMRKLEMAFKEEQAHDDERETMLREQRRIREDQGVGRRWCVGLFVTVSLSLLASITSIVVSIA